MNEYQHHVSGFFVHRDEAISAFTKLVEQGLPRERLHIFETNPVQLIAASKADSKEVLHDVIVDGAIGTAIGSGIGALGGVALAATGVSLFIASPLIAPLMLLGWGATVGGLIGATAGAENTHGDFSELIRDAVASGQVVLVAETRTVQETMIAQDVIQAATGVYNDNNAEV